MNIEKNYILTFIGILILNLRLEKKNQLFFHLYILINILVYNYTKKDRIYFSNIDLSKKICKYFPPTVILFFSR